jgi:predicted secreted protein
VNLDEGSDGKTIDLGVGQSVVLMLAASPTSGFDWSVTKAPAALGAPAMGYLPPPGDGMGAPGKRRITWTVKSALPAGEQTVELAYRRGFEQGVPALKTFRFKVRAAH